jgi:hypothetical protein
LSPPPHKAFLQQSFAVNWQTRQPGPALYCVPALVIVLIGGLVLRQIALATVMAGAAFTVGFGVFQRLTPHRVVPMALAALGTSVSAAIGTVVSQNAILGAACVALWTYALGVSTGFGNGIWWVILQSSIALVVAAGFPAGPRDALLRSVVVLAGAAIQIACVTGLRRLLPDPFPPLCPPNAADPPANAAAWRRAFREGLGDDAALTAYAIAFSFTAGLADFLARTLALANGYWVTMTVLLVLRRAGQDTFRRGFLRIGGTLLGAGLATLVAALARPAPPTLIVLVAVSAWASYASQWVNYGVFSTWVTAYVAFLLAFGGLPETAVATRRIVATAMGGGLSMAVLGLLWLRATTARKLGRT